MKKDNALNDEDLGSVSGGAYIGPCIVYATEPGKDNLLSDEELGSVAGGADVGEEEYETYVVGRKETIIQVAIKFSTTAGKIRRINGMHKSQDLRYGMVIKVPKRPRL